MPPDPFDSGDDFIDYIDGGRLLADTLASLSAVDIAAAVFALPVEQLRAIVIERALRDGLDRARRSPHSGPNP